MKSFLLALLLTLVFAAGIVYFVQELWPILPGWVSMLVFIFIAVVVIGYPIYSLARWSDRKFARQEKPVTPKTKTRSAYDDEEDSDW